jgi:threonine synthase
MEKFKSYRCSVCGKTYGPQEVTYTCPADGGNLDIILDYQGIKKEFSPEKIVASGDQSHWRYLPLLPVDDPGLEGTTLRAVGWTPVFRPKPLAKELGLEQLWIKDDGRNPTASFKDRASSLVIARAREIGAEIVVTSSSGNAGAALAGMAAAAKQDTVIFVPKAAPQAKVAQLLVFGARVFLVDGVYDDAFELSRMASEEFGWYSRNTGINPFTAEGKKTAGFEIWEQVIYKSGLKKPLTVFVPVGDGNIISGIHKGFKDLMELGWLEQMPRIFGVQPEGSASVANAFFAGNEDIKPVKAETIADSVSVDHPHDGLRALRAATQTGGRYVTITDQHILKAIARLGLEGIFAEPAAASAYAGLESAIEQGFIEPSDPVLVMLTGSGLKDVKAAISAVKEAPIVKPTLEALKKVL